MTEMLYSRPIGLDNEEKKLTIVMKNSEFMSEAVERTERETNDR